MFILFLIGSNSTGVHAAAAGLQFCRGWIFADFRQDNV
jgi:hypothetical protein